MMRTAVAVAVFAFLATGCPDTTSEGTAQETTNTSATEPTTGPTTEPPLEPTEPETTGKKQKKPSIKLANAPIGGSGPDQDGVEQCVEVNWLATGQLRSGTTVTFGSPSLDPEGVFELDQSACPSNTNTPCQDHTVSAGDITPCYVGGRQVANGTKEVFVHIEAAATCKTQDDCDRLLDEKGGSSVAFVPGPLETPTNETPSGETPSNG